MAVITVMNSSSVTNEEIEALSDPTQGHGGAEIGSQVLKVQYVHCGFSVH